MGIIILIGLVILLVWLLVRFLKFIHVGNMICISGGIKTGKTTFAIFLCRCLVTFAKLRTWLFNYVFRFLFYPFYCWFRKFKVSKKKQMPQLYSNIPLACRYIPVSRELLERKEKPIPKSVCYMCEASLVADSMSYRDSVLNEELLLFNKLWGHASHGGYLVYDTQSISDNHFAVKRCLSSYIYIHHMTKGLFFLWFWIREERYSEDGSTVNNYDSDVEEKLKLCIIPKSVWKLFDCYCYSSFTDDLPDGEKNLRDDRKRKDLKARDIVSFKTFQTLYKRKDDKK